MVGVSRVVNAGNGVVHRADASGGGVKTFRQLPKEYHPFLPHRRLGDRLLTTLERKLTWQPEETIAAII